VITPAALRTEADLTLPGEEAPTVEVEEVPEAGEETPEGEAPEGEPQGGADAGEGGES